MNIGELQGILERLERMYMAAGANGPAKDLKSVMRILDGHEEKSIEDFVAETRALLASPARGSRNEGPGSTDLADEYARRLLAAGTDQSEFERTLTQIDQDNRVRKPDWIVMANRYLNEPTGAAHRYSFKSIREARNTIRDAFVERFESAGKKGIVKRLTRWAS